MTKPKWLDALQTGYQGVETFYKICKHEETTGVSDMKLEQLMDDLGAKKDYYLEHGSQAQKLALSVGQYVRLDRLLEISAYCVSSPK